MRFGDICTHILTPTAMLARRGLAWHSRHMPYAWTTDDDELAHNAIIVSIGGTDAEMIAAGLSYAEPGASVVWLAMVTPLGVFDAGGETGFTVPDALARASALQQQMGADRVVVSLQEVGMWQDAWGELAANEGL